MKNNAEKHRIQIKIFLLVLFFILFTPYLLANTFDQLVDCKTTNEYIFAVTPENTAITENTIQKPWFQTAAQFFSPTKTLVPMLVIYPEGTETATDFGDSENTDTAINNPDDIYKKDAKVAIAETSRGMPQEVHSVDRNAPTNVDEKENNDYSTNSSGGHSGKSKAEWKVGVYDDEKKYTQGITTLVNIFADSNDELSRKIIYPGIEGKFLFTVDNTNNDYNILYNVSFTESCIGDLPMEYRIKSDAGYVGGNDSWHEVNALNSLILNVPMKNNKKETYTLEWRWPESDKDNQYKKYGGSDYILKISVYAQAH